MISSGLRKVDSVINGFRKGNTYLMAGFEKSGKSSLCIQMALHMAKKLKVVYIDTELTEFEFLVYQNAIATNTPKRLIEEQNLDPVSENLIRLGMNEFIPKDKYEPDFELILKRLSEVEADVIFFDNLTRFAQNAGPRVGWEVLSKCISQLVVFAKQHDVAVFPVVHTKSQTVLNERPGMISKLIEAGEAEKIFEIDKPIIRRPSGVDIYGGGSARSQVSGTIIVWRPFQMLTDSNELPRLTSLLLENFRHSSGGLVRMDFDGEVGVFSEVATADEERAALYEDEI